MQGTCIWKIYWGGLVDKNNRLVAQGGVIELRAPNPFLALGELVRALCLMLPDIGNCYFVEKGFTIRKVADNPIVRIGEGPTEDAFPKVFVIYGKEKLESVG